LIKNKIIVLVLVLFFNSSTSVAMMDESWCFNECMDSVFLGKTLCCLVGVVVVGGCYKIVNNILLSVNGCVER
jgi:hypothetical protein